MELQVEPQENHSVRLTITLDDETVNRARREVARALSKRFHIPGFRPGHAPLGAVIRAVGGEEAFNLELADYLAKQVYPKALDEAKVNPYGPGTIIEVKASPFQIVAHVPLEPTVDLKDYRSIRLPFPEIVVSEEEIEQELEKLREENAIIQLAERPAAISDLVEVKIEAKHQDSGDLALETEEEILLTTEKEDELLPGLSEFIIGMSAGERKEFALTMPEDVSYDTMRGATLDVTIEVKRVNSRTLPDINDELAQTVGNFTTLAELREDLRQKLAKRKEAIEKENFTVQVLDAFTALAEVRYPPEFIEDQLDKVVEEYSEDVERTLKMPFKEWLKIRNQTVEGIREELRAIAESRGRRGLVMRALVEAEGLTVDDEEIDTRIAYIAGPYPDTAIMRAPSASDLRRTIKNNILSNKVLQRMVQIARGELESATPEPAQS
jgi:trigger factor